MHIKNVARRIGRELNRALETSGRAYLSTWEGADRNFSTRTDVDRIRSNSHHD